MVDNIFKKFKFEIIFGAIALLVILLDQLTKYLILDYKPNLNLLIITIHLIQNTGAGFGILKNQAFFLGIISLCAALLVLFYYHKIEKQYFPQILFGMFLGGVIGNLIDRWFRGFVVDFLDLPFWPAFNVADACITLSVIGLVIWYWKKRE
mgnify:CR=1 FL=1